MSDHYLWDRSAPPDPQIQHLERVLGALRYRGSPDLGRIPPRAAWRRFAPVAAAAAVLIGIAVWQFMPRSEGRQTAWELLGTGKRVYAGQVIRTGRASTLTLQSDAVGRVDVQPDSELRIVESRAAHDRLALPRGRIHVLIWAPPRQFVVDTPSARAIDLGCQYTLSVAPDGNGLLNVESGWVAFQYDGLESFIPAGAACVTRKGRGPGTPFFSDAPAVLRDSLDAVDHTGDGAALHRVLAAARPRDALTLWHLLARAPRAERGAVFDRFAQLVSLPPEVTRAAVLANDPRALDLCWNALNLENADWWREWKRPYQPQ